MNIDIVMIMKIKNLLMSCEYNFFGTAIGIQLITLKLFI